MEKQELKNMFIQWVDAWNARDMEKLLSLYAEDAVLYQAWAKKKLEGLEFVSARFKDLRDMSDDSKVIIRELFADEDTVIAEITFAGTHNGPFLDFEPTGKKFDIDTIFTLKVKDGKIIKHNSYLETATVLRVLDLLRMPSTREEAA